VTDTASIPDPAEKYDTEWDLIDSEDDDDDDE
jgi:hypothetical protein